MKRQNDFTNCPCQTLPPCSQLQVAPKPPQGEKVPQAKASYCSSYYAPCYPRQTSERSSAQKRRTPPQKRSEDKSAQEHHGSSRPTKPKEPRRVYTPTRGCCVCKEVDCACTCCLQPPPKSNVHAQTSEYFLREKSSQTPQKSKCCRCCRCCRNRGGRNNCVNCLNSVQDERLDSTQNERLDSTQNERLDSTQNERLNSIHNERLNSIQSERLNSIQNERLHDSTNVSVEKDYPATRKSRMVPGKDSTLMTRTHSAQCSISEEAPPLSKISDFVEGLFGGKRYQVGDFRPPSSKDYLGAYWSGHKFLGGVKAFETHFMKQIERLEEKINVLACNVNSGRDFGATNPGPKEELNALACNVNSGRGYGVTNPGSKEELNALAYNVNSGPGRGYGATNPGPEEELNALACNVNSGRAYGATDPGPEKVPPDNDVVRFIYEAKNPNDQEEPKWVCLDHCDSSFPPYYGSGGCGGGLEERGESQRSFDALMSESREAEKLLEKIEKRI